jgi:hypothetical protein
MLDSPYPLLWLGPLGREAGEEPLGHLSATWRIVGEMVPSDSVLLVGWCDHRLITCRSGLLV